MWCLDVGLLFGWLFDLFGGVGVAWVVACCLCVCLVFLGLGGVGLLGGTWFVCLLLVLWILCCFVVLLVSLVVFGWFVVFGSFFLVVFIGVLWSGFWLLCRCFFIC